MPRVSPWSPSRNRPALSRYLRDISLFPVMEQEVEQKILTRLAAGDPAARTSLVHGNLSFVVRIASEYRSMGVPYEDLLNEGNIGLLEAARRFDPARGVKFITYAIWWIRKRILKALSDHSLVVRVPSYSRKQIYDLRKAETDLHGALGRKPSRAELAEHLDVDVSRIDRLMRQALANTSLDKPTGDESGAPLGDFIPDERISAEDRLLQDEVAVLVVEAFRQLPERERAVLGWRLGLPDQEPQTLKEISDRLKISRERVRQIENMAKSRVRRMLLASLRDIPRRVQ